MLREASRKEKQLGCGTLGSSLLLRQVCGPVSFNETMRSHLEDLRVEHIILCP